ncbi:hypothetical protein FNV43_RR02062 [Rhamnella rubrinervis]|uniref:Uncharacterized protein n=1 Tax=Rhamnella rubrinervis TaxID=2594499 RepID=A0A8K0HRN0_9ROSA|nr:hypothetical protein FNV43_RR02062 [Rhamnella rubrinervis]
MIVVFTRGDQLEDGDETLEDYLSRACDDSLKVRHCNLVHEYDSKLPGNREGVGHRSCIGNLSVPCTNLDVHKVM